jgi:hypothetical protein
MSRETAHTPTPWRLIEVTADDEYPLPNVGDHRLAGADDVSPGIIFGGYPTLAGVDGNAAFIVRACNSHDALTRALDFLCDSCERCGGTGNVQLPEVSATPCGRCSGARAVLKAAKP